MNKIPLINVFILPTEKMYILHIGDTVGTTTIFFVTFILSQIMAGTGSKGDLLVTAICAAGKSVSVCWQLLLNSLRYSDLS